MKKATLQIKKENVKFLPLIFTAIIVMFTSCNPSINEAQTQKKPELRREVVDVDRDFIYDVTYYDISGCEYVGKLTGYYGDFISHSGQCKRCENRQIHLMDSLIKENLKTFFTIEKK